MSAQEADFFSQYLAYNKDTEAPAIFYRWSLLSGIGAFLGRQYYFEHGHFTIYPNMYTMLIGSAGTRKSYSIKLMRKILLEAGYNTIAADKTTKEKFLLDLDGTSDDVSVGMNGHDFLDQNLFGEDNVDREIFVMADEFNDFFGNNNIEFISLLGTLWDYTGVYRNRIKSGKSVAIHNPTVNILGGNTPTGFALAFPPEILGQGFFSRILLIYGEPNGKRITFPKQPEQGATTAIIEHLRAIKSSVHGRCNLSKPAERLLDRIYQSNHRIADVRFESYANRRFTHLIKLCLIVSASRLSVEISERDVIFANTILTHAERLMPKALGQFGKSRNSDVVHKVVEYIYNAPKAVSVREIWQQVHADLEKMPQLAEILIGLVEAKKIQRVPAADGFLPLRAKMAEEDINTVDYSLLSEEERNMRL